MKSCPLCKKQVLYQGLTTLECESLKGQCLNGSLEFEERWPKVGDKCVHNSRYTIAHITHIDPGLDWIVLGDGEGWPYFVDRRRFWQDWTVVTP